MTNNLDSNNVGLLSSNYLQILEDVAIAKEGNLPKNYDKVKTREDKIELLEDKIYAGNFPRPKKFY